MSNLIIQGPCRIHGTLPQSGILVAALPAIAASVLTDETVVLRNMPDIVDVRNMLCVVQALGGKTSFAEGVAEITAGALCGNEVPEELSSRIRTSLLFAGPLAVRLGNVWMGLPGGDMIGRRRFDTHFYGLRKLGISIEEERGGYRFTAGKLTPAELFLDEASVTATEHILMTAAAIPGRTILRNAACEPHVQQLAEMLNAMGAHIEGAGTNTLVIEGCETLHGCVCEIESDYVEVASYMALCAAAGGDLTVTGNIAPHQYWMTRRVFERFNCSFTLQPGRIDLESPEELRILPDLNNAIPVVSDGPWPQFPSDMMSCMIAMATQAKGTVLFFEKMFESRLYFVDKLIGMGASAIVCDPHRVVISGPARLHGAELTSPDIRAGMAIVIAACCAQGESVIHNIEMVYRGYQNLPEKLRALGVNVRQEE